MQKTRVPAVGGINWKLDIFWGTPQSKQEEIINIYFFDFGFWLKVLIHILQIIWL